MRLRCVASRRVVAHRLSSARAGFAMDAPPASPAWAALAPLRAWTTDALARPTSEKDNNQIMQVMWGKEIMPVSYSALDKSGRAWQFRDAAGGAFYVLQYRAAGGDGPHTILKSGSFAYIRLQLLH